MLASFSCRVYAETQGRKLRPVAALTIDTPRLTMHCADVYSQLPLTLYILHMLILPRLTMHCADTANFR